MSSFRDRLTGGFTSFFDQYVNLVTNKVFDMAMVVVWIAFLAISIKVGILNAFAMSGNKLTAFPGYHTDANQSHSKEAVLLGFVAPRG